MDLALEDRQLGMPVSSSPRGLDLEQMAPEGESEEGGSAHASVSEAERDAGSNGPWARNSCGLDNSAGPAWPLGRTLGLGGQVLPPFEENEGQGAQRKVNAFEGEAALGGLRPLGDVPGPGIAEAAGGSTLHLGSECGQEVAGAAREHTPHSHPTALFPPPNPLFRMQPAGLSAAPLIPEFNGLQPRTLAASAWSRANSSAWAAPNLAGLLNASVPMPSLAASSPSSRTQQPLENSKRGSPTLVLPVPDDLAARASGAWHASVGHNGLPPGTLELVTSATLPVPIGGEKLKAELGLPPGRSREWTLTHRPEPVRVQDMKAGNKPDWLSLDLMSAPKEAPDSALSEAGTRRDPVKGEPPTAFHAPSASPSRLLRSLEQNAATAGVNGGGNVASSGQTAQLVEEQSAWYEKFKANIPNIAAAAQTVPVSTWAHVVGSGVKPPSPVLPSPGKPEGGSAFTSERGGAGAEVRAQERQDASRGQRPSVRRQEADLLSQMEVKEAGGWEEGTTTPPLAQAAGLIFGGGYNAVVEAERMKALKEIGALNLPTLLANPSSQRRPKTPPVLTHIPMPATPPSSFPTTPTPAIPSRALAAFLTAALPQQTICMDPLKPLDLPATARPPHDDSAVEAARVYSGFRASTPASVSLRGWGARSGTSSVASLDMNSPLGGQQTRKRSVEGSDSGEDARLFNKKAKGKTGRAQEPSTKLTLEMGGGGKRERGVEAEGPRAQATPKGQSAAQVSSPGLGPSGLSGGAAVSAAASPSYAAYVESMKGGMSLSMGGGPAQTTTPTASSSGSGAASSVVQNRAPGAPKLWRSSSDETWTSEHARVYMEEGGGGEEGKGSLWKGVFRGPGESRPWDPQSTGVGAVTMEGNANEGVDAEPTAGFPVGLLGSHGGRMRTPPPLANSQQLPGHSPGRSVASLLGGYTAKLPGWPDKPMPADEYLKALQNSEFRLEVEPPKDQAPHEGDTH